jgi:hypothetical protein
MDWRDTDLTDKTTQPVKGDLWPFVTMALATLFFALLILLGLCNHV